MIAWTTVRTNLGPFHVAALGDAIIETSLPGVAADAFGSEVAARWPGETLQKDPHHPILLQATRELEEYAAGRRTDFTVKTKAKGTEFQRRVWKELAAIPYGEVRSYGEVAEAVGSPGASRAVGQANHRNPVAPFIPCHRVVTSDGKLGGYGGGVELKQKMLALEGVSLG
ncbi:MAG: methylated-DNA--[protein]-cysteine S-methyltransferase [Candidatus Thermoplasmatota archaeon]